MIKRVKGYRLHTLTVGLISSIVFFSYFYWLSWLKIEDEKDGLIKHCVPSRIV